MVESKLTYEQMRKRILEENKKRMEELNMKNLSQALKNASPKSSPGKPRTPRQRLELTTVRRSSRVADKPKPNYKDVPLQPLERTRRKAYAIGRAEHLESTLGSDYSSFVKPMFQSHVTGEFWLSGFARNTCLIIDEMITLVDEEEDEFATKYLAERTGLSGGWRGFSIDHNLVEGDALVFQLLTPTEFKVYIIRAYESEDNGGGEDGEEDDKEPGVEPDVQVLERSAKRIRTRK